MRVYVPFGDGSLVSFDGSMPTAMFFSRKRLRRLGSETVGPWPGPWSPRGVYKKSCADGSGAEASIPRPSPRPMSLAGIRTERERID